MTTIAYRDGKLVADTATFVHDGNTRVPEGKSRKILRLADGSLIAGSGIKREVIDFAQWYSGDRKGNKPATDNSTVFHLFPDGRKIMYDGSHDERDVSDCEFYAIGSGAAAALGALYAGASAENAVRIAMKIDPWTDGDIQVEEI